MAMHRNTTMKTWIIGSIKHFENWPKHLILLTEVRNQMDQSDSSTHNLPSLISGIKDSQHPSFRTCASENSVNK